jgi:phasin family protein
MTVAKTAKPAAVAAAATPVEDAPTVQTPAIESVSIQALPANAFKGYEEFLEFGKANVEALLKSSSIMVRGVQDLSQSIASMAQESFEESVSTSKALIGAKTLKEMLDLSSSLAKANFDKLLVETGRLSQLSTKLAEDAFAPLNKRVDAAVQKFAKVAA